MEQVVRRSSITHITRGRFMGTHVSTKETVISSSSGDTSRSPVFMIVNSSELLTTGFKLKKVLPPELETVSRVDLRTLKGLFPERFVL